MEIGQLTAGDGTVTTFTLQNLPQIIFVGDTGALQDVEGIEIDVDGQPIWALAISDEGVLDVLAQLGHYMADGANNLSGSFFLISNGYLENVPCTVKITNADGVATPTVYGIWLNQTDINNFDPVEARTEIVLQSQPKYIDGTQFDYLLFDDGNYQKADIQFATGATMSALTEIELKALLNQFGNVPAGVEAGNVIVVDNTAKMIASITLYATGGNITVVNINM